MKDFLIALVSFAIIGKMVSANKSNSGILQENWGTNPAQTVQIETVAVSENGDLTGARKNPNASAAMSLSAEDGSKYEANLFTVPPNLQNSLQLYDRGAGGNVGLPATISYSLPAQSMLASTGSEASLGPQGVMRAQGQVPSSCCAKQSQSPSQAAAAMRVGSFEGYEDYEPISSSAGNVSRAQAMADQSLVKKANAPTMDLETQDGPVKVSVYDRLMYSNSKSRLRGEGDPIRGDIGCIVPIRDQWFRPSARPNIDLRQGAISILAGIDNETPRELKALQNAYSAGTSTKDSYDYQINPQITQKSIGQSGNKGAYQDVQVAAYY